MDGVPRAVGTEIWKNEAYAHNHFHIFAHDLVRPIWAYHLFYLLNNSLPRDPSLKDLKVRIQVEPDLASLLPPQPILYPESRNSWTINIHFLPFTPVVDQRNV